MLTANHIGWCTRGNHPRPNRAVGYYASTNNQVHCLWGGGDPAATVYKRRFRSVDHEPHGDGDSGQTESAGSSGRRGVRRVKGTTGFLTLIVTISYWGRAIHTHDVEGGVVRRREPRTALGIRIRFPSVRKVRGKRQTGRWIALRSVLQTGTCSDPCQEKIKQLVSESHCRSIRRVRTRRFILFVIEWR